jgi:hypothetical protein
MVETLLNALDVNGYRKHHQLGFSLLNDEDVLRSMHRRRVRSWHQSPQAKAKSEWWLREHAPKRAG